MYNVRWIIVNLPCFMESQLQGFSWIETVLLAASGIAGYFLLLYLFRGTGGRKLDRMLVFSGSLLVVCVAVILEITLFRRNVAGDGIIHTELDFGSLHRDYYAAERMVYSLLNVFLFVPFGMAYRLLRRRDGALYVAVMTILTGFCCSFGIELCQLLLHKGYFEMVDIICNTIGCFLGVIPVSLLFSFMYFLRGKNHGK